MSAARGRVITSATLHVHGVGGEILRRVTVSTLAAEFVEGTSPNYATQAGASCFNFRQYPDVPWAFPGSDLTAVMLGQGGSIWHSADASPPDANGWQTIAVDPSLIAARVAGISGGFVLFDDTGSEWTRDGERFSAPIASPIASSSQPRVRREDRALLHCDAWVGRYDAARRAHRSAH